MGRNIANRIAAGDKGDDAYRLEPSASDELDRAIRLAVRSYETRQQSAIYSGNFKPVPPAPTFRVADYS